MTQWLFNFVIAKITPLMLANITYGTFLLFGSLCIVMTAYAIFCVPETKGVPLESIHILFEGSIIKGALKDNIPRYTRARQLAHHHNTGDTESDIDAKRTSIGKAADVEHIEARV